MVRLLAPRLTRVRAGECLCCYVARQLDVGPCDRTPRSALRYRDAVAPRATALHERLHRVGACCDCELFLNAYTLQPQFWTPAHEVQEDGVTYCIDAQEPEHLPPCAGVRRGSAQPCSNWVRIRRWYGR